ncbi:DUF4253 domain-containing protein [Lawsonella clevelandensis]|uniref:DUF4253 domain-containing protein n=1 Tax=Lawsonella clevelandensis TaxID=1528099 RepID=UPI0023F3C312|nr:DUF4253 domain-containing protein [Lawsonella clevelandensis]
MTSTPDFGHGRNEPGLHQQLWSYQVPTRKTLDLFNFEPDEILFNMDGNFGGCNYKASHDELRHLWLEAARLFPRTGLWPLLSDSRDIWKGTCIGKRGWGNDEYYQPVLMYDGHFLENAYDFYRYVLSELEYTPEEIEEDFNEEFGDLGEWNRHPDLARAARQPDDILSRLEVPGIESNKGKHPYRSLVLVACHRPSDAIALVDRGLIANEDVTPYIYWKILRGWELRFGVVPVSFGIWTDFQCLMPPDEEIDAKLFSHEIFAFAEDSYCQGGISTELGGKLEILGKARQWEIWWD